jgi:sugar/nucleoside kinase (ribokinase family)
VLDVLGFGESSVDYVYTVPALPRAGASKLPIASHYSSCGGQVATTIAACAAFGLNAGYLGVVGDDENGDRVRKEMNARGVDLSRLVVRGAASRYAVIMVEESTGERLVLWERDARLDLAPADVVPAMVAGAKVVHLDATDEGASIALARLARSAGAIVTCDVDTVTERTAEFLSLVSIPILAAHVPRELTGVDNVDDALRALRATHRGLICVTLGEEGSAALDGDRFVHVPATSVRAVDTTAAGDVFRAGLIHGILQGWPVDRMLRFGNAAAALSCTRRGAMDSIPDLHSVDALLR